MVSSILVEQGLYSYLLVRTSRVENWGRTLRKIIKGVCVLALAAGCTQSVATAIYSGQSSSSLWLAQSIEKDPMKLAMIEAELGSRGETHSGAYRYLGSRTSKSVGKRLYSRDSGSALSGNPKNCSDFSSSAAAQKFFLSVGGPTRDPHNLDGDGDGLACEWGAQLKRTASKYRYKYKTPRRSFSRCYVGPRGGTYTITASGKKNYNGC